MPVRLGHLRIMDPSDGCYTPLSFDIWIVKRQGLSSEAPSCPGEDLPILLWSLHFWGQEVNYTKTGAVENQRLASQDQSGVNSIFIMFLHVGKPVLGFGQNLSIWATENQKIPDTPRTKGHKDDRQARGLLT